MVINDNLFKGNPEWFPPLFAGKLSDVAGLFFFPALLSALAALMLGRPSRSAIWIGACATVVAFTAIQLHHGAADAYVATLSWIRIPVEALRIVISEGDLKWERPSLRHTMDPADLWTLPAAMAGAWHTDRRLRESTG